MNLSHKLLYFTFLFSFFNLSSQQDSRKFTYNESDKNYINYEQLEELTSKFLVNEKSKDNMSELAAQQAIYIDKSELPNYSDEELHKKILSIPATIPMKFNAEVGQLIRYFLFERREYMCRMLTYSNTYFPIFEEVLDEKDLPIELKNLAIVESALNPNARSRCGATGLWQFMHGTAKHEGMEINSLVDERSDIYKSTEFAAGYLKKLYNIYGDWLLALAAYNSGPGNVNKAIKNSGGYDFWTIKHKLPKETQNYVPSFIAITYAMHFAKEYKLQGAKPAINFQNSYSEKLYEKQSLKYIAELVGTTEDELKKYNPSLKKGIVPQQSNGFTIYLPKEYSTIFQSKKHLLNLDPYIYNPGYTPPPSIDDNTFLAQSNSNSIEITYPSGYTESAIPVKSNNNSNSEVSKKDPRTYASSPVTNTSYSAVPKSNTTNDYKIVKVTEVTKKTITHTVRKGENLTEIADKYNVSLSELKNWNNISRGENLFVGKKLKIEQTQKVSKPQYVASNNSSLPKMTEETSTNSVSSGDVVVHKLKKGETIIQLSRIYGCSVADIKEWNNLKGEDVKVGQEIFVYNENKSHQIKSYSYYEAKSGDTLLQASIKFNIPLDVLKSLNNKEADEPLRKGEKIKIPSL